MNDDELFEKMKEYGMNREEMEIVRKAYESFLNNLKGSTESKPEENKQQIKPKVEISGNLNKLDSRDFQIFINDIKKCDTVEDFLKNF